MIDLDFKYPAERALERLFDLSHIHDFLQRYVTHLTHFYDLEGHRPLRFFVTLRPAPYEDKKANALQRSIKDGVHIQCPDLVLSSEHQQVLRHRSLEMNDLPIAFKGTGYINDQKDIFDEAIVKKNGWFFYGESKPDIPAYQLAVVYTYDPQTGRMEEEKKEDYHPRQLLELLSIRYNLQKRIHRVSPRPRWKNGKHAWTIALADALWRVVRLPPRLQWTTAAMKNTMW